VGVVAALVFRGSDWRISTLGIVSLVLVLSAPTSLAKTLAACLYIVISWLAMKLVSSLMGPSAPVTAGRNYNFEMRAVSHVRRRNVRA